MSELTALMRRLLVGNPRAYAEQQTSGEYRAIRKPLTDQLLSGHLAGLVTLGTYLQVAPGRTRHLVLDLDERSPEKALVLRRLLQHYQLPALLSDSGNKGYHLWTCFAQPVPSAQARRVGRALVSLAEESLGGAVQCDVFPDGQGELGRVVKLPLGLHRRTGERCSLLDEGFQAQEPTQVLRGYVQPDPWALQSAEEELPLERLLQGAPTLESLPQLTAPSGGFPCLEGISQGVDEGARETAAFILAKHLWRLGLGEDLVREYLHTWNRRNRPPLPAEELEQKVLHGAGYRAFGCEQIGGNQLLQGLCRWRECPNRPALERAAGGAMVLPAGLPARQAISPGGLHRSARRARFR